jgi:hypothetical protein
MALVRESRGKLVGVSGAVGRLLKRFGEGVGWSCAVERRWTMGLEAETVREDGVDERTDDMARSLPLWTGDEGWTDGFEDADTNVSLDEAPESDPGETGRMSVEISKDLSSALVDLNLCKDTTLDSAMFLAAMLEVLSGSTGGSSRLGVLTIRRGCGDITLAVDLRTIFGLLVAWSRSMDRFGFRLGFAGADGRV